MTRRRRGRTADGVSLVEYVLLVGLIALACVVSLKVFGTSRDNSLSKSGSTMFPALVSTSLAPDENLPAFGVIHDPPPLVLGQD